MRTPKRTAIAIATLPLALAAFAGCQSNPARPIDWPDRPAKTIDVGPDQYFAYDLDHDNRLDYLQRQRNGHKDRLYFISNETGTIEHVVSRPKRDRQTRPLLVLLLDGVAYERITTLYEAGRFRLFHRPARLISVFPTLTDPAYDVLFNTGPTPGYEAGYYDAEANSLTNAYRVYLSGKNEAWVRYADYRLNFIEDAIMYVFPKWVYENELERMRRVLDDQLASGSRVVVLYQLSTDALGHMLPPCEIDRQLMRLDAWLERVTYEYRGAIEIFMLADHGLGWLPPDCDKLAAFDIAAVLKSAGLRIRSRLTQSGDVALPQFGLLDVARVHAFDDETRDRVAEALRHRKEIELVAVRHADRVRIYAGDASAEVLRRDSPHGPEYAYVPIQGDPLRLRPSLKSLQNQNARSEPTFAAPDAWLRATATLDYPAAPERLWRGLFEISRERPDVVVSLTDRWFVGSGTLASFVEMKGTHGGLHRRASETMAMSTSLQLPSPLDLEDVADVLSTEFGWNPGRAAKYGQKTAHDGDNVDMMVD